MTIRNIQMLYRLFIMLTLAIVVSCGSNGSQSASTGGITAQLEWNPSGKTTAKTVASAPVGVVTVRIIISAANMTTIQKDFAATSGSGTIVGIPSGTGRSLTAQGLDGTGTIIYQGSAANLTVLGWQTTNAGTITMAAVAPVVVPSSIWKWRNPLPQGNTLSAVTYGGGLYVGVGGVGTIVTSTDGITWTNQNTGTPFGLSAVAYGTNLYVAVGNNGTIVTSPDGINWTNRASGTTSLVEGVFYGGGKFVAVAGGTILTSTNGIAWSSQAAGAGNYLHAITYGNSMFVAIGTAGYAASNSPPMIMTSTDGVTWTKQYSGQSNVENFYNPFTHSDTVITSITYGGGQFVAVAGNEILTSANGITWSKKAAGTNNYLYGVAYGSGKFVVVGYRGNDYSTILTSTDGVTWASTTSGTEYALNSIVYGTNKFVVVGQSGTILTSSDGAAWSNQTRGELTGSFTNPTPGPISGLNGVAYGGGMFVAVGTTSGYSAGILTSVDGNAWTIQTPFNSFPGDSSQYLNSITYGTGTFVAVGYKGVIYTSANGVTWSEPTSGTTTELNGITYGGGKFVVVGNSGTILTSIDGVTWTTRISGTTSILNSIAYGGGKFVAVGNTGTILTSPDGITWTSAPYTTFHSNAVTYGGGKFIAVADNTYTALNNILTSADGITWTTQSSGTTSNLVGVTYGGSQFIAVGGNGIILTSSDGISWVGSISCTNNYLSSVAYNNGKSVIVGSSGTIITN